MTKKELALALHDCALLHGSFTLRSGQVSTHYFDKYAFEANPLLLRAVAKELAKELSGHQVIAGIELGGIPLATALSLETGIATAFVRKERKQYGTARLVEGSAISGKRVMVVEDVITTAGQVIESIEAMREEGASIDTALCVLLRDEAGRKNLKAIGVTLQSLFDTNDIPLP